MKRPVKILLNITSLTLIAISLYFRYEGLKFISFDTINFVFSWYEYIEKYGLREALRHDFLNYNYSLAYLYLIALAGSTRSFLNRGSWYQVVWVCIWRFQRLCHLQDRFSQIQEPNHFTPCGQPVFYIADYHPQQQLLGTGWQCLHLLPVMLCILYLVRPTSMGGGYLGVRLFVQAAGHLPDAIFAVCHINQKDEMVASSSIPSGLSVNDVTGGICRQADMGHIQFLSRTIQKQPFVDLQQFQHL